MTKEQMKNDALARGINEEAERVKARDKRHAEFWEGLKEIDIAVRHNQMTPQDHVRWILGEDIRAFDKGVVPKECGGWNVLDYIGSFDMTYAYPGVMPDGRDEKTGHTYYTIYGNWDSLDEVSLTEILRKELTRYLTAAGSLAKRTGSSTYEGWVQLMMDINFTFRNSFHIFSKDYPFEAFREKIEALNRHLWADSAIAQHTPHTRK